MTCYVKNGIINILHLNFFVEIPAVLKFLSRLQASEKLFFKTRISQVPVESRQRVLEN